MTEDSDAMWRIKESVRIKTSVIKIINVLDQTRGMKRYVPYFGKVDYKNTVGVVDWMKEALEGGSGNLLKAFADSLFIKRSELAHENEVRFIVSKPINKENNTNPDVFDSHIDFDVGCRIQEKTLFTTFAVTRLYFGSKGIYAETKS